MFISALDQAKGECPQAELLTFPGSNSAAVVETVLGDKV